MNYVLDNWSFDPFAIVVACCGRPARDGVWPTCGVGRTRRGPAGVATVPSSSTPGWVMLLLIAIMSPIDYWASGYFFVHMSSTS